MPSLALKIPPVIQLLTTLLLAYLLAISYHGPVWPLAIAALPLAAAAFFFMLGGVIAFRRSQTTVDPRDPSKAQCLVRRGVFKYSRNPMYLGMLLLQTAFCCYLHEVYAFVTVPLLWLSLRELQIKSEEQSLLALFGEGYQQYCQQVRRWI
jgi:protein-S-isoprenylcysteine O-methyltransferase Ste14